MHRINSIQFRQAVKLDPAWASKLTEPVEITDYCDMAKSDITHLSPLLTFAGGKDSASFQRCAYLKVVEGNFKGHVDFAYSGVEKIDPNVTVTPDRSGYAASFKGCASLKEVAGTFWGLVNFEDSGIERITSLEIKKPAEGGKAASFAGCIYLKIAAGKFCGDVDFDRSGIEKIDPVNLIITKCSDEGHAASFAECKHLEVMEGHFPGWVNLYESGVTTIGDFSIQKSNHVGEWVTLENTGIPPEKMVRHLFGNKSMEENKKILEKMNEDEPMHLPLKSLIAKQVIQAANLPTPEI